MSLYTPHQCDLGQPYPHGAITQCNACGRVWRAHWPGNPDYGRWARLYWFNKWIYRRHLRTDNV